MFRFRLLVLFFIFCFVGSLMAANKPDDSIDDLFADSEPVKEAQKAVTPVQATPKVVEVKEYSPNTTKKDAKNDKKSKEKDNQKAKALVAKTIFKENEYKNYYGIHTLVLRIAVQKDKSGHIIGLKEEKVPAVVTVDSYKDDPNYYLNLEKNHLRESHESVPPLYDTHKKLLLEFVSKIPKDQDAIVFMYVNGTSLQDYNVQTMHAEKSIYSQYITTYLYQAKKRIRVEKRYLETIPEDEIFMIIARYNGSMNQNVYNVTKSDVLQWLLQYKNLEKQKSKQTYQEKKQLEETINSVTKRKNTQEYYSTPVQREVVPLHNVAEPDLTQLRKLPPRASDVQSNSESKLPTEEGATGDSTEDSTAVSSEQSQ